MKIKTAFVALALAVAPGLAFAGGGCDAMKSKVTASTCTEGQVFDQATGLCMPGTTS